MPTGINGLIGRTWSWSSSKIKNHLIQEHILKQEWFPFILWILCCPLDIAFEIQGSANFFVHILLTHRKEKTLQVCGKYCYKLKVWENWNWIQILIIKTVQLTNIWSLLLIWDHLNKFNPSSVNEIYYFLTRLNYRKTRFKSV